MTQELLEQAQATPYALRADDHADELTVTSAAPHLAWKPAASCTSTSFEVEARVVGDGLVRRSRIEGLHAPWPWAPLRSRDRVQWRVRGLTPQTFWSEWAAFEVGLRDSDWTASWISPNEDGQDRTAPRPAYLLSGSFVPEGDVRSARLYSTALGVYTVTINTERVGAIELAPGSTSYDRTLYAQAADPTRTIVPGRNTIDVELSDGWYRGRVGAFRTPAEWGTATAFRGELHLDLVDGRTQVVRTDASWTSTLTTIRRASLMDGQSTDLTAPRHHLTRAAVTHVDAPPITWSPAPPVRVVQSRPAITTTRPKPGVWVLDFGQNASGWVKLTDLGPAGTRTTIDFGEHLASDGDLTTAHLDSERPGQPPKQFVQRDEVVSDGTTAVFEPRHTIHGFRYARVTRSSAAFDPASATMQVVHTDLNRTGSFASSNTDLNRLHQIADWSFRSNAVDVPTDCPTRERLAWTGDYQVFAPTATRLYDVLGFTRKWLQSVRDDQLEDGRIANFSPDGRRIKHHLDDQFAMMTGSSGWGDAIVAVPWELYQSYGDVRVLAENWDAATRWISWVTDKAATTRHHTREQASPEPEPFEQYLWDGTFHWGEWTEPQQVGKDGTRINPITDNPMAWFMADKGETGTAYFHRSVSTMACIAEVLGKLEDARRYADLADRILAAWRQAYLRPDGTTVTDTQAAYVRALSFGLIPDGLRSTAADRLVALIREAGNHLGTGFLSTGDLLPVLTEHGRSDVAHALLFQRTEPSWMTMIDRGATTIWEDWHGVDENGDAHASLNHYSKGAVIRYLHTHVLGLRQAPGSVGWRRILIAPTFVPEVSHASGHHDGPQGRIDVAWTSNAGVFTLETSIPPLTTAQVILPDGTEHAVGPGTHHFATAPSALAR
ncbi:Bacterial alpha-L-rhamnosidase [Microbacterium azadirachtae]|uniref:alpha-L-rhamnosidase n=1 Tax=Microbacterium azadirachtae TaxID=582680 RepID=A0A0F0KV04_9MICO|nr:alpha-L-rhamnosidase [Microbacterium azadirachtae]KJL24304.1 Bacterial alpha-L-rhamnosidase [Microbacterium azadirachtae]